MLTYQLKKDVYGSIFEGGSCFVRIPIAPLEHDPASRALSHRRLRRSLTRFVSLRHLRTSFLVFSLRDEKWVMSKGWFLLRTRSFPVLTLDAFRVPSHLDVMDAHVDLHRSIPRSPFIVVTQMGVDRCFRPRPRPHPRRHHHCCQAD